MSWLLDRIGMARAHPDDAPAETRNHKPSPFASLYKVGDSTIEKHLSQVIQAAASGAADVVASAPELLAVVKEDIVDAAIRICMTESKCLDPARMCPSTYTRRPWRLPASLT